MNVWVTILVFMAGACFGLFIMAIFAAKGYGEAIDDEDWSDMDNFEEDFYRS